MAETLPEAESIIDYRVFVGMDMSFKTPLGAACEIVGIEDGEESISIQYLLAGEKVGFSIDKSCITKEGNTYRIVSPQPIAEIGINELLITPKL